MLHTCMLTRFALDGNILLAVGSIAGLISLTVIGGRCHLGKHLFQLLSVGVISLIVRILILSSGQLNLKIHHGFWINTEGTIGILALESVSIIASVAFALMVVSSFCDPFDFLAFCINITGMRVGGRDVFAVPLLALTIVSVLTVSATTPSFRVRPCDSVLGTLVASLVTPGAVRFCSVLVAWKSLGGEGELIVTNSWTPSLGLVRVFPSEAVHMHGESTLLDPANPLPAAGTFLLGHIPPTGTFFPRNCEPLEYFGTGRRTNICTTSFYWWFFACRLLWRFLSWLFGRFFSRSLPSSFNLSK